MARDVAAPLSRSEGAGARRPILLFLVAEDWYFCSHRLPLAVAAREAGYRVVVATRVGDQGERIRGAGLELVPLSMRRRGGGIRGELRGLAELVQLYRRLRPDVVHHVALKPVAFGSVAAAAAGVSVVVNAVAGLGYLFSADAPEAHRLRRVLLPVLRRLLRRPGAWLIVQNPDDQRLLHDAGAAPPGRTVLIRGAGVDLAEFAPAPEAPGPVTVVLAGRLLWDKGVGEFVDAARRLRAEGTGARFALVGAPDLDNPGSVTPEQLERWTAEGIIEHWGRRNDMPAVFAAAHVVALPSAYAEGVPKVLIEAAAAGRAIVTTDAPGCREVVRDGVNGILVPVRDAGALADALRRLIESPELRRCMGERGRQLAVSEFGLDQVVDATLRLYEEARRSAASS